MVVECQPVPATKEKEPQPQLFKYNIISTIKIMIPLD